jgi:predicted GIY-YIG superfamily endonuclease
VSEWISLMESLPTEMTVVILSTSEGKIYFGYNSGDCFRIKNHCWHERDDWRKHEYDREIIDVTHWMPLPEAPKE